MSPHATQWLVAEANFLRAARQHQAEGDAVGHRLAARFFEQAADCRAKAFAYRTKRQVML